MIYAFVTNSIVLMFICAFLVFGEMFLVKKWYTSFTKKIANAKVRRTANLGLGVVTCLVLALSQMAAICDVFAIPYIWNFAIASGFIATGVYLALEKILGAEVDEVGKMFCDVISHSDKFNGNITHDGMVSVARQMLAIVKKIDDAEKQKENEAVAKVCAKIDEFLADGHLTAYEKEQAKKLIDESGVEVSTFYNKYSEMLK